MNTSFRKSGIERERERERGRGEQRQTNQNENKDRTLKELNKILISMNENKEMNKVQERR